MADRGEVLLECIEREVDERLNPSGDDCPECGGDGVVYSCFEEWACVDPEGGCSECESRCRECARHNYARLKAIRQEVIKSDDVDIARAWLKEHGRLTDDVTNEVIRAEMAKAAAAILGDQGASTLTATIYPQAAMTQGTDSTVQSDLNARKQAQGESAKSELNGQDAWGTSTLSATEGQGK